MRSGGNTACVEMRCGEIRLIFDAGTGIRALDREWELSGQPLTVCIFLSHTHLDHIPGLPFLRPACRRGNRLQLWAGHL